MKSKLTFRSIDEISEVFNITMTTVLDIIKKHRIKKELLWAKNYIDIQRFYNVYIKHYNPCLFCDDTKNTGPRKKTNLDLNNILTHFGSIDDFLCKSHKDNGKAKNLWDSLFGMSSFR